MALSINELIKLLQDSTQNKDREMDIYINVQHDKEIELVMIDQFSVRIQS